MKKTAYAGCILDNSLCNLFSLHLILFILPFSHVSNSYFTASPGSLFCLLSPSLSFFSAPLYLLLCHLPNTTSQQDTGIALIRGMPCTATQFLHLFFSFFFQGKDMTVPVSEGPSLKIHDLSEYSLCRKHKGCNTLHSDVQLHNCSVVKFNIFNNQNKRTLFWILHICWFEELDCHKDNEWAGSGFNISDCTYNITPNCFAQFCAPQLRGHCRSLLLYRFMFTAPKSPQLFDCNGIQFVWKIWGHGSQKAAAIVSVHVFVCTRTCKQIFLDWMTPLLCHLKFVSQPTIVEKESQHKWTWTHLERQMFGRLWKQLASVLLQHVSNYFLAPAFSPKSTCLYTTKAEEAPMGPQHLLR